MIALLESAVYVTDEAKAWIAQRLLEGDLPELVVDRLVEDGMPREAARECVSDAAASPYMRACAAFERRTRKIEQLLNLYTELWRRSVRSRAIPEHRTLDERTFNQSYYYRNRPVIVRSGAAHWPAVGKWSPAYFRAHFGDAPIEYMYGADRYDANRRKAATMREFVDRLDVTIAANDFYVVATNHSLRRHGLRPLQDDLRTLPWAPEIDPGNPDAMRLWIGPRGTLTALHHDVMSVMFVQIYGTKEFILAPSWCLPLVYNDTRLRSRIDPAAPDFVRHPSAAKIPWLKATVRAGDVLFIPVGWWHWVYAATTSISVGCGDFTVDGVYDEWKGVEV